MENSTIKIVSNARIASAPIELPILTADQIAGQPSTIPFPTGKQLRQFEAKYDECIYYRAIRVVTNDWQATSNYFPGVPIVATGEVLNYLLTIYQDGRERAHQMPLSVLLATASARQSGPLGYFTDWQDINWTKSYLTRTAPPPGVFAPFVILFDVQYWKEDRKGNDIKGGTT